MSETFSVMVMVSRTLTGQTRGPIQAHYAGPLQGAFREQRGMEAQSNRSHFTDPDRRRRSKLFSKLSIMVPDPTTLSVKFGDMRKLKV